MGTKLEFVGFIMPSATLGKMNPLPDLQMDADQHANIAIDEDTVTRDEAKYMGWGRVNGILPYLIQNGYNRKKKPHKWNAAVLENEHIRATFLPELGGRLWSLFDKDAGRELLHCNPVFQPCNLALRNAWISGGVEWNIGIIGHTPFTVDKMFTEELKLADGTPVLRMYQYERIRGLVYRVEAMLPDDSRQLYVRVRIDNTTKKDTAVYWWSNMAVNEGEDVRVIVPAHKAYRYGYGGKLSKVEVPYMDVEAAKLKGSPKIGDENGLLHWDVSRTTQLPQAMDFFFDLPKGQRRWISVVRDDGDGFAQTSTDVLQGRKLFVWGMGAGGRNWQTFLSQPGSAYIEVQAGLAHTQLEHLPMKGGETIDWMEAYGPVHVDSAITTAHDWDAAVENVETALEATCPREKVDGMLLRARKELDGKHGHMIMKGAGWARVQLLIDPEFNDAGLKFPKSCIGDEEKQWVELVENGKLPCPGVLDEPMSYQIGPEWEWMLGESVGRGDSAHWYGHYQLGVMRAHRNDRSMARESFEASLKCEKNPWALRCLGVLDHMEGRDDSAAWCLLEAVKMLPERNIAIEAMTALNRAGRQFETIDVYNALPAQIKTLGRIRVLLIEALLDTGELARAERLLNNKIELTDVREGEVKLTDLWFRLCALKRSGNGEVSDELLDQVKRECVPPEHLDFRMN